MLKMHHNRGGMQDVYSDERISGRLPDLRFKKGKVTIEMSKPVTIKYKTDRISFFLSVSIAMFPSVHFNAHFKERL